jgi:putative membrane-bound dehydrogenase-like protein
MKYGCLAAGLLFFVFACKEKKDQLPVKVYKPAYTSRFADSVAKLINPPVDSGSSLTMKLWGIDSLVISPVAIDVDDLGRVYYNKTNRQVNSEFDIRAHRDWEIASISLQTVEDRRKFLHTELAPENSARNGWLTDVNGDSSRDWRDLTVETEVVYRLEDADGDGVADLSRMVVNDFHDEVTDVAGGVLADGNDLYVAVAPDLWRMKDKNGDGIPDEKTSISTGYGIHIGFSGHGMSGVEMGPDGKIYWQIGDIGFNGKGPDGTKYEHPNSGVIARSNPDGSDFEIFAHGLRNTHEFAFDQYGNLISEDNDGDHAGERERLVYIVNGSDAGWRSNWQYGKYNDPDNNTYKVWMEEKMYLPRWEGQAAYITPCITNYVSGPAGFVYNPGTALSPEYKNHFFVAEFVGSAAGSGVHGFTLKPKGASFELGSTKKVVGGVLPTGLDFGPDGALYIADWIDGWGTGLFGRIWKLDDEKLAATEIRKQVKALLAADFSKEGEQKLSELLSHEDMRIRMKAQFELAKRGEGSMKIFEAALKQTGNQLARIHAIWGICQLARKKDSHAQVLLPYLKDADPEIRSQAAKWLGDIKYKAAGAALLPLLKDEQARVRFFAAEALGRITHAPAVQPIIDMLRANNDEDAYIRHAGSLALARIGDAKPVLALAIDSSTALRIAAVVALRRMANPGIAVFLKDNNEFIVTETARAINDDLSIPEALPALGDLLVTTRFKNEALIRRAINANLRVGTEKAMQNLLAYAAMEAQPAPMRVEAITALSTWVKPSVLDRVDGRLRGEVKRDPAPVQQQAGQPLITLMSNRDAAVRLAATQAVSKLQIRPATQVLGSVLKKDTDPKVRRAALLSLADLKYENMGDAIKQALSDKEKEVRVAGIDLLGKATLPADLMASLLSDVINTRSTEEKQAALLTLGKVPVVQSQPVFEQQLSKLEAGSLSPDIRIELEEAIDSTGSAALKERLKGITAKLDQGNALAAYAAAMYGGRAERGRRIFYSNQAAQCIRCHAIDDYGGNAGPRLNDISKRITRVQILEALVNPSARLSPGYGMVTLKLKGGETISGILQEEKATSLLVKSGDAAPVNYDKAQIEKRIDATSSMPAMGEVLSKKEIRDLVSFLSEL